MAIAVTNGTPVGGPAFAGLLSGGQPLLRRLSRERQDS
jgi:hypothetical protein